MSRPRRGFYFYQDFGTPEESSIRKQINPSHEEFIAASTDPSITQLPMSSVEMNDIHRAVQEGSADQVRQLIENGADINIGPDPPLHLALRRKDSVIAHILLQAKADFNMKDSYGDAPIHIACSKGLLDIVHTLCALGCSTDTPTLKGLHPLHLAAKYGHIDVVRCLCAAGCNIDAKNADGIKADITALKYGHNDIAELIDKLRATGNRDSYARQLVPTSKTAYRISVRVLGNSGVGKTSLVKSLGAGLFSALFRRSSSVHSNKSRPSSPVSSQIELDVTPRQNSLTFETSGKHDHSSRGIHIQKLDVSNVGDVMVLDFSGQESYFPVYHNFLRPSPYALTLILFSLEEPQPVQIQQVGFWLNFVLARQQAGLPTCEYGKVVIVATHVDTTRATKSQQGEWISPDAQKTFETIREQFKHIPKLHSSLVLMDCNAPHSFSFKQLKALLTNMKQECAQLSIGSWTGLLEHTLSWLPHLHKEYDQFPVLKREEFSNLLHANVNPLALDSHITKLLQQLHTMVEIFCIRDLVVICVSWLAYSLIGDLLSPHFISRARVTGVYTAIDFQSVYTEYDANGVLDVMQAMDLCVQCETEDGATDEVEYEFPIYNRMELSDGQWEPEDWRYGIRDSTYGGLRISSAIRVYHMMTSVFPYIQTAMRRTFIDECGRNECNELYQWYHGAKFTFDDLECIISLDEDSNAKQYIEVKARAPKLSSKHCFYFMHGIVNCIEKAIRFVCPGLLIERHILSAFQLKTHAADPYCHEPDVILSAILDAEVTMDVELYNPVTDRMETILQLILFDDPSLAGCIIWGCALKLEDLPPPAKLRLCGLLDPPDVHGRDWCLLALKLGFDEHDIASFDSSHQTNTMRVLTTADCTIAVLVAALHDLDRPDAAEVVLRSAPLFKIIIMNEVYTS